jgi:hypothetical protein
VRLANAFAPLSAEPTLLDDAIDEGHSTGRDAYIDDVLSSLNAFEQDNQGTPGGD